MTVAQVAKRLKLTPRYVQFLCSTGSLKAEKVQPDPIYPERWEIDPDSVEEYYKKRGRP